MLAFGVAASASTSDAMVVCCAARDTLHDIDVSLYLPRNVQFLELQFQLPPVFDERLVSLLWLFFSQLQNEDGVTTTSLAAAPGGGDEDWLCKRLQARRRRTTSTTPCGKRQAATTTTRSIANRYHRYDPTNSEGNDTNN